jgi:O-antigen ligase
MLCYLPALRVERYLQGSPRMRFLVPCTVAMIALAICPGLLFHYDVTPKVVVLLGAAACALCIFTLRLQEFADALSRTRVCWFVLLLVAQIGWAAVSAFTSADVQLSLFGSTWRRDGLITYSAVLLFALLACAWFSQSTANVVVALRALSLGGGVLALYMALQYLGLDPLLNGRLYRTGDGPFEIVRPPGTFGHADYAAAWLTITVFGGIALQAIESKRLWKLLAVASACLAAFSVVLSGTRSALLGLAAGLFSFAVYTSLRLRGTILIRGGAALLVIVLFTFSPTGRFLRARVHWISEDSSGGARLLLWRDSIKLWKSAPWLGEGPETFTLYFPRYTSRELAHQYPDFYHESPHNLWLDELAASGVPGLLLLCGSIALSVSIALASSEGANPTERRVKGASLGGLIGLLACAQFAVLIPGTLFGLYLLQSLIVGYAGGATRPRPIPMTLLTRTALSGLALLFAGVFLVYGVRLAAADYAAGRTEHFISLAGLDGARKSYMTLLKWRLGGGSDDVVFSRMFLNIANKADTPARRAESWQLGFQCATRSVSQAEDRQNAWYNLAQVLAARNDAGAVEHSLRTAILWAPNWFKPHWALAEVLRLQGQIVDAARESAIAVDLDGGKHGEVKATNSSLQDATRGARGRP